MRTLLAIAILIGGTFAPSATADAARKIKRSATPPYYYNPKVESECERRARAEDPAGQYAAYPCWARETFGRGSSGGRGR